MPNGRKILFAALAASMWPAATVLPAAPAQALPPGYGSCEYDPYWRGWYRNYVYGREPCTPTYAESAGVCVYDELSGGWYRFYVFGFEPCDPPV